MGINPVSVQKMNKAKKYKLLLDDKEYSETQGILEISMVWLMRTYKDLTSVKMVKSFVKNDK